MTPESLPCHVRPDVRCSDAGAPLPERIGWLAVLAPHDRPQADRAAVPALDHRVLLPRRILRAADPAGAADAGQRPDDAGRLQPRVHDARRHHGVLLPDPVDPGDARQLPAADHDRREGPGVPADQPAQLVHLRRRRLFRAGGAHRRRRRHRLDVLHAVQLDGVELARAHWRGSASSSPASRRSSPASTSSSPCTACGRRA